MVILTHLRAQPLCQGNTPDTPRGRQCCWPSTGHTRVGNQGLGDASWPWKWSSFVSDSPGITCWTTVTCVWTGERSRGDSESSKTFSTQEGSLFKEEDITHKLQLPRCPGALCSHSSGRPAFTKLAPEPLLLELSANPSPHL